MLFFVNTTQVSRIDPEHGANFAGGSEVGGVFASGEAAAQFAALGCSFSAQRSAEMFVLDNCEAFYAAPIKLTVVVEGHRLTVESAREEDHAELVAEINAAPHGRDRRFVAAW